MRAALTPTPGMHALVPRIAVSAAAAAILLRRKRRKEAGSSAESETFDKSIYNAPKNSGIMAKLPRSAPAAATRWTGLLLPNIFVVSSSVLAWLALILIPIRSWMVSAVPHMQFADEQTTKQAVDLDTVKAFCGRWAKDTQRSDSMDGFCQLFGVPRWLRKATRLMTGLEITTSGDMLLVKQVCKISWLSTTEAFPLDGVHTSVQKRRDMRSGKQTGQLLSASDNTMQLHVEWQGSMPGEATDTLQLRQADTALELAVTHEAAVINKGSATFKEVYIKQT